MPEPGSSDFLPVAIVLAAGRSSRLGQPKQLVQVCIHPDAPGEPLLRRTAQLALSAFSTPSAGHAVGPSPEHLPSRIPAPAADSRVLIVLPGPSPANAPLIAACRQALADLPVDLVHNPDSAEGMGTSIRAAMAALPQVAPAATHVLLLVCDQPLLTPAHLQSLWAATQQSPQAVTAAFYSDRLGVPAIFPRLYFPELQALSGDQGARHLLQTLPVTPIPMPQAAFDLDTPDDLRHLASRLKVLQGIP